MNHTHSLPAMNAHHRMIALKALPTILELLAELAGAAIVLDLAPL
jgi:hypothetical protein